MRNRVIIVALALLVDSCAKPIYLEREKVVEVKEYITTTDTVYTPKVEREEVVQYVEITDTSKLNTTYAYSEAFVTNGKLQHCLLNNPSAFKFRINIPTFHRDSIIRTREPYPVEVIKEVKHIPAFYQVCFWLILGEVLLAITAIVLKFKRIL